MTKKVTEDGVVQLEAEQQLLSRCRYSAVIRVPRFLYGSVENSFESPVTCFLTSTVDRVDLQELQHPSLHSDRRKKKRYSGNRNEVFKCITVDHSRSSSLAVINSAQSDRVTFAPVGL